MLKTEKLKASKNGILERKRSTTQMYSPIMIPTMLLVFYLLVTATYNRRPTEKKSNQKYRISHGMMLIALITS